MVLASVTVLEAAGRELGAWPQPSQSKARSIYNWKEGWEEMSHRRHTSAPGAGEAPAGQ